MAQRLQVRFRLVRAAAVTATATVVSVPVSGAGPTWAVAGAQPVGGQVASISCASAGACAAVGYLNFPDYQSPPLVVSEKNGTWGSAGTVRGLSALPGGDQGADLAAVSCWSAGNCAAGGEYDQVSGGEPVQGLLVTETSGVWGKAQAVRGLAGLNKGGGATIELMSCRSAGDCTAAGIYSANDANFQVFVVSETKGAWGTAEPIRGLAALGAHDATVGALSCGSPGDCAITGTYQTQNGSEAFAATQHNGAWSKVQTFPAIAAASANAGIGALSCWPGGNCTAAGSYGTSRGPDVFATSLSRGTWSAPTLIPGLAARPGTYNLVLSCPSPGTCTLGGAYGSQSNDMALFTAAEKNGTWATAQPLPGIAALNTGKNATFGGMVCFSAGTCTAAGQYTIARKNPTAAIFVAAEQNGSWGTAERVPGSLVNLGTAVTLAALSCGAPRYCSIGGFYYTKIDDEPFLATERNGIWGKAARVQGIQP